MRCEAGLENLCLDALDGYWWAVPFELIVLLYTFLGLARVADNYLVTSLETLCVRLHVREDVAGASFMAFGSAAPEIIVNAISTIKAVTSDGDSAEETALGIGAIIGSGMIAFTLIPGACALCSDEALHLKRRPLLRDLLFYATSLLCLLAFVSDGVIHIAEAYFMLALYAVYMAVVVSSSHVRTLYRMRVLGLAPRPRASFVHGAAPPSPNAEPLPPVDEHNAPGGLPTPSLASADWATGAVHSVPVAAGAAEGGESAIEGVEWDSLPLEASPLEMAHADESDGSTWTVAFPLELDSSYGGGGSTQDSGGRSRGSAGSGGPAAALASIGECASGARLGELVETLAKPLDALFAWTCPECSHDGPHAAWYPLTFAMSFVWVSAFSMVIAAVVSHWGELSGVPRSFLGLAIIAIGAEVPDTIQSVTVARRGYGSMAVSNSFGSQIINILVGLGMPWAISNTAGQPIEIVHVSDIHRMGALQALNVAALFSALLGVALIRRRDKAVLTRAKGFALLAMYVLAVGSYAIMAFVSSGGRASPPATPTAGPRSE